MQNQLDKLGFSKSEVQCINTEHFGDMRAIPHGRKLLLSSGALHLSARQDLLASLELPSAGSCFEVPHCH